MASFTGYPSIRGEEDGNLPPIAQPLTHPRTQLFVSRDEFVDFLAHERAIADYYGDHFALVTFTASDSSSRRSMPALASVVEQRLWTTDIAGWLSDGRCLAVLMPRSSGARAKAFVNDLLQELPEGSERPWARVYVYPSDEQDWEAKQSSHGRVSKGENSRRPAGGESGNREKADGAADGNGDGPAMVCPLAPFLVQRTPPLKRCLDVFGATVALVLLSPLLLILALAVKLTSAGPVFFRQQRRGLGGRPFTLYKFRSMTVDADARQAEVMALNEQDGPAFKIRSDPRVTRLDRFMRKTSLDELPQFWNVLKGEMSLVGPRPLYCPEADACQRWHKARHDVVPGLTCTWQVFGRSRVSFDEWMRMALQYIRTRSMKQDLKLILRTILVIVRPNGC